ncbi:hypothetical protein D7I43_29160 [Micromonospora globbae]|jgi:hypothetical protein|uniref:Uncharacterized protein n=1 Tax=Micromonospora globbae TaxID=1894969 RepID=A0A420ET70_9ACTN|nr:hypothetical protein D7I43_29160 [Micromonospora globbae]
MVGVDSVFEVEPPGLGDLGSPHPAAAADVNEATSLQGPCRLPLVHSIGPAQVVTISDST